MPSTVHPNVNFHGPEPLETLIQKLDTFEHSGQKLHAHLERRAEGGLIIHLYAPSDREVGAYLKGEISQLVLDQSFGPPDRRPTIGGVVVQRTSGGVTVSSHT